MLFYAFINFSSTHFRFYFCFKYICLSGGVGIFTRGCHSQWNAPWSGWGQQYGGVNSLEECQQLPTALQPGCEFRFNWYQNADNPAVTFQEIECPSEITDITNCP